MATTIYDAFPLPSKALQIFLYRFVDFRIRPSPLINFAWKYPGHSFRISHKFLHIINLPFATVNSWEVLVLRSFVCVQIKLTFMIADFVMINLINFVVKHDRIIRQFASENSFKDTINIWLLHLCEIIDLWTIQYLSTIVSVCDFHIL